MRIPDVLAASWRHEPGWLAELPTLAAECAAEWDLALERPIASPRSLVVPAGDAVLKLNAPSHREAEHEADALALWDGRGAVRLLARDDERRALLLERCRPGTPLADDPTAPEVVPGLLDDLRTEAAGTHPFRLLVGEAEHWSDELLHRNRCAPAAIDGRLLELASETLRTVDRRAAWLVNQDLHGGNVLRAERRPWLVTDPKPLVGERELDGVGLLRNAAWTASPRVSVRRWLDALDGLGLDRERLVGWGVAHALAWGWSESGWSLRHLEAARAIAAA